jgi:hypothetical protein
MLTQMIFSSAMKKAAVSRSIFSVEANKKAAGEARRLVLGPSPD